MPGMAKKEKCPGLLFAGDIASLADLVEMAHKVLEGVTKWSREWQMPMGALKCNIMLVNGTDEEQEALKNENFSVDGRKIEVTRSYKYLGIVIMDKLGDVEQTDEMNHAEMLASRVKQVVNIRRPFLGSQVPDTHQDGSHCLKDNVGRNIWWRIDSLQPEVHPKNPALNQCSPNTGIRFIDTQQDICVKTPHLGTWPPLDRGEDGRTMSPPLVQKSRAMNMAGTLRQRGK